MNNTKATVEAKERESLISQLSDNLRQIIGNYGDHSLVQFLAEGSLDLLTAIMFSPPSSEGAKNAGGHSALKEKMKKYFDSTTAEDIIAKFEEMGYTFTDETPTFLTPPAK